MNTSGLNKENLPKVAHDATHIPDFTWYKPAQTDVIEEVKAIPPAVRDVVLPNASLPNPTNPFVAAPLPQASLSRNISAPAQLPLSGNLSAPPMQSFAPKSMAPKSIEIGNLTPAPVQIPIRSEPEFKFGGSRMIDALEEKERSRRMAQPVDSVLLGRWRQLILPSIKDRSLSGSGFHSNPLYKPSYRPTPSSIRDLEEKERAYRMHTGVNPLLTGKFQKMIFPYIRERKIAPTLPYVPSATRAVKNLAGNALEKAENVASSAANTASNLAGTALNKAENAASTASNLAGNALNKAEDVASSAANTASNLAGTALNKAEDVASGAANLAGTALNKAEDVASGAANLAGNALYKAENAAIGASKVAANLAGTALNKAEDAAITAGHLAGNLLEKAEDVAIGASKVAANLAGTALEKAEDAAIGASHLVGNLAENLVEKAKTVNAPLYTETQPASSIVYLAPLSKTLPLQSETYIINLPRRAPLEIIRLEEEERARRIKEGVNPVLLGKQRRLILRKILAYRQATLAPTVSTAAAETMKSAANTASHVASDLATSATHVASDLASTATHAASDLASTATHAASNATHAAMNVASGLVGMVGDVTGNVIGRARELTHDLTEAAKDKLGMVDINSTAYVTKEEEKERLRRMNAKTDPMLEARKRRVEEELLRDVKPAC